MIYLKKLDDTVILTQHAADADYILVEAHGESYFDFEDMLDNLAVGLRYRPVRLAQHYDGVGIYILYLSRGSRRCNFSTARALHDDFMDEFECVKDLVESIDNGCYKFK